MLWWTLLGIPMARNVRHNFGIDANGIGIGKAIQGAFARLAATVGDARSNKPVFMFLLTYFFYIDGVHTIITTATAYGRDLGLSAVFLVVLVLFIQVVAWPFLLPARRVESRR